MFVADDVGDGFAQVLQGGFPLVAVGEGEGFFAVGFDELPGFFESGFVVVAEDADDFGNEGGEAVEERGGFFGGTFAVHDIAHEDEAFGAVVGDEIAQGFLALGHAPVGQEGALLAADGFVTEVDVRDGEPALAGVHEGAPAVQKDVGGHLCSGKSF